MFRVFWGSFFFEKLHTQIEKLPKIHRKFTQNFTWEFADAPQNVHAKFTREIHTEIHRTFAQKFTQEYTFISFSMASRFART